MINFLKMHENGVLYYYGDTLFFKTGTYEYCRLNALQEHVVLSLHQGLNTSEIFARLISEFHQQDTVKTRGLFEQLVNNLVDNKIVKYSSEPETRPLVIFGKKGKTYPWWVLAELTNICNYSCPHCYKEAAATGTTFLI